MKHAYTDAQPRATQMHNRSEISEYANCPAWVEKAQDAAHRAAIAASHDGEVSDDWLDDEGEFDSEEAA